jgi:GAF domain-containing protein
MGQRRYLLTPTRINEMSNSLFIAGTIHRLTFLRDPYASLLALGVGFASALRPEGRGPVDQRRLTRLLNSLHETDSTASVVQRLCVVCAHTTTLEGAGISRLSGGRHQFVAASDAAAAIIEMLQVTFAEGPCVEVIASVRPVLEPDLRSARAHDLWPRFAPEAVEHGIAAVFAFPLMARGVALGALDVYSSRSADLGSDQLEDARLLADLAALAVDQLDAEPRIADVGVSVEAPEPWAYPAVVHNASGLISEQLNIHVDEALLRLRAVSFVIERTVVDVARDVVARRVYIEAWSKDD